MTTSEQEQAQTRLKASPSFDISNEAWREYIYPVKDGSVSLRVEGAHTLILDKRPDGDRHRLIIANADGTENGMYVTPGWLAIQWQDHEGHHGIEF